MWYRNIINWLQSSSYEHTKTKIYNRWYWRYIHSVIVTDQFSGRQKRRMNSIVTSQDTWCTGNLFPLENNKTLLRLWIWYPFNVCLLTHEYTLLLVWLWPASNYLHHLLNVLQWQTATRSDHRKIDNQVVMIATVWCSDHRQHLF